MKITLEVTEKRVEIKTDADDYDIQELWNHLIRPALIAWGYAEETVDSLVGANETN